MHKEILTKEQLELLPLLKKYSKNFGLVGGTAIALHIGHRESIDFDLFSYEEFSSPEIKRSVTRKVRFIKTLVNRKGEFTFLCNKVKITFYHYPYKIKYKNNLNNTIKIPDLLTLAAMKAFALGQRAKWKDYADLYFIIKDYCSIDQITAKANRLFKKEFNEKIFRTQLSYFDDINYAEKINYLPGFKVSDSKIKKSLVEFSLGQ